MLGWSSSILKLGWSRFKCAIELGAFGEASLGLAWLKWCGDQLSESAPEVEKDMRSALCLSYNGSSQGA